MNVHLLRTLIINTISAAVALGLAANRRKNRDIEPRPWPAGAEAGAQAPFVQIIIPARNEERNIADILDTLSRQTYPTGRWGITVVNDGSSDQTANIARSLASEIPYLQVMDAPMLPEHITGKNHAMWTGYLASPAHARWLLFVDADTRHTPEMLSSVVRHAEETGADLLSLVIDVHMDSFWERVLVPQVGELYTLLVGTMDQVNSKGEKAAANGQFILIKRDLYGAMGGLEEVRSDVAEDRALAGASKSRGYSVRLEYGRKLVQARVYSSLREMWGGYSKTLFWASGRDLPKAVAVGLALAMYALLPPLALAYALMRSKYPMRRQALAHAALQIVPMLAVRGAVCRQVGIPAVYALTYPLGVAVGDAMLGFSVYRVLSGKGVVWKGRTYRR